MNHAGRDLLVLRRNALAHQMQLRAQKASALTYGRFYQRLLDSQVWPTQLELSAGLSVSKGHVSKALKAVRLPIEVVRTFGPERRVSFRVVDALAKLGEVIGAERLVKHAEGLGERSDLPVAEILDSLVRGVRPDFVPKSVKMSVGRGGLYIRIDSPDITEMIARLHEIELAFDVAVRMSGL